MDRRCLFRGEGLRVARAEPVRWPASSAGRLVCMPVGGRTVACLGTAALGWSNARGR